MQICPWCTSGYSVRLNSNNLSYKTWEDLRDCSRSAAETLFRKWLHLWVALVLCVFSLSLPKWVQFSHWNDSLNTALSPPRTMLRTMSECGVFHWCTTATFSQSPALSSITAKWPKGSKKEKKAYQRWLFDERRFVGEREASEKMLEKNEANIVALKHLKVLIPLS